MKHFEYSYNPSRKVWRSLCTRPMLQTEDLTELCKMVFSEVETNGDDALLRFTRDFDKVDLSSFYMTEDEITDAAASVENSLALAINQAYANIFSFHKAQIPEVIEVMTVPGVVCKQDFRPIERVGLYIPGGSAPLFSTLLMLAIPAKLAGCSDIVLCTPPNKNGEIHSAICYAAQLCGIDKVLKLGGVQAITALVCGTSKTDPVYKICGPGNQYVVAAKRYAQDLGVSIDMPAGPSEVLVIADATANPQFVAADLLSQAEHGPDSQVVLLTTEEGFIEAVFKEIKLLLPSLSRKEIIQKALSSARFIVFNTLSKCIEFSNQYAPEHLILAVDSPEEWAESVVNAGSVFLRNYSPESAGDYASGTNHTLPTNGFARCYSGVNTMTFLKKITFQKLTSQGISLLSPTIEKMAEAEGLEAHALAASIRRKSILNERE